MRLAALTIAIACVAGQAVQKPIETGFGAGAYPAGTYYPELRSSQKASYPREAIAAGASGSVFLEAVVNPKGNVSDVRVTKSADARLDASALAALKSWRFSPVTVDGKTVAVVLPVEIEFTLHRDGDKVKGQTRAILTAEPFPENVIEATAPGVTAPAILRSIAPKYTADAMREKIQGDVQMKIVIGTDGRVTHARITRSLDATHGLDYAALQAAKLWRFKPCIRDGAAVACVADLVLSFNLH